ncbi:hypothetical protein [Natronobacterium texcoconense]|uniref:Uncharacterized protein n=1 Tax=Natronobacterium texcoconense TaxID=1095778 RepID=A0A1H1H096_NATTX|nr:hypothetical protein [Natronobacterium texcoconense]SDR18799.1 hypothetical protein SAMN04489842_2713 [Natronobacterium texcoconense]
MSRRDERLKQILLMLFAIQVSILVVIFPSLYPLLLIVLVLVSTVLFMEFTHWFDEYTWGG